MGDSRARTDAHAFGHGAGARMRRVFRVLPRTDGHFLRQFFLFLGLCVAVCAALLLVADLSQKFKQIANQASGERGMGPALWLIVRYYAVFVPQFLLVHLLPIMLMFAGVFAVTRAAAQNEFIALEAAGVSLRRLVTPMFIAALAVGGVYAATRDAFLPGLIVRAHQLANILRPGQMSTVAFIMPDGDRIQEVSIGHFDPDGRAHNFMLHEQTPEDVRAGRHRFYQAREAVIYPQGPSAARAYAWAASSPDARRTELSPTRRHESMWSMDEKIATPMTPPMFARHAMGDDVLGADDLAKLAPNDPYARQERAQRHAAPGTCLVTTLLGVAAAMMAMRRGNKPSYVVNLLLSLLAAAGYMLLASFFAGFGQRETLAPALAAWLPVGLGLLAGTLMLARAE